MLKADCCENHFCRVDKAEQIIFKSKPIGLSHCFVHYHLSDRLQGSHPYTTNVRFTETSWKRWAANYIFSFKREIKLTKVVLSFSPPLFFFRVNMKKRRSTSLLVSGKEPKVDHCKLDHREHRPTKSSQLRMTFYLNTQETQLFSWLLIMSGNQYG